jgi:hypothetical protein
VVDRLTKYAHFFAIPSEYNTSQVADIFFQEVFRLHGLPRYIGQRLVAGELGHLESLEGELIGRLESTEDVCRQAQDRAQL